MRRFAVISLVWLAACAATQEGLVVEVDARPPQELSPPDAPGVPDARPVPDSRPDAPIVFDARPPDSPIPDATPRPPDSPMPDAEPVDAQPTPPDAQEPDACSRNFELCNYRDDNCNGQVDEGYPNLGLPCTVGMGGCQRTGKIICSDDMLGTKCSVEPGLPSPVELCHNFVDDNCNGQVDEGFENWGLPCTVGMGACQRTGVLECNDTGTGLKCSVDPGTAVTEICHNFIDDDCDGSVDENSQDWGQPCTVGVGACQASGTKVCDPMDPTKPTVCSATPGTPTPDICDGIDNDCNASTPDGSQDLRILFAQPCGAGPNDQCPTGHYVGCVNGQLVCSDTTVNNTTTDPNNCGFCGHQCTNANGGVSCVPSPGNPAAGVCSPSCTFGFQSCDNNPDNGCETQRTSSTAACSTPIDMGHIDGDSDAADNYQQVSSGVEAWYKISVDETTFDFGDLNAKVSLTNPANARFGIFAECTSCSGNSKSVEPDFGKEDHIYFGSANHSFHDDTFHVLVHVYYIDGVWLNASCPGYTLKISGTEEVSDRTCNGGDHP